MSLYYEAADLLTGSTNSGGSLKSRIFKNKDLKSQPAQVYALAIETAKWSSVLKEVIERADFLRLERKITPILSVLLVHDLLLAKKGIALPAIHGLKAAIERHKNRLQAEFTKVRIRRKLGSLEAFKEFIESGLENDAEASEAPYPRWIRINTLKTTLEDQFDTTFAGYERATSVKAVRQRGIKRLYIDGNIPNLVAISPCVDLSKSNAYKSGAIIFQDKASCFPAYLLDPLPQDGDIIDSCSAPGNKTTHLAAILISHSPEREECSQTIHAFEKNKNRAETLEKMVKLAGSNEFTKLHPGQDFLKTDPNSPAYKDVGALLLDPSCSGSGIIGRDDMPDLHLPIIKEAPAKYVTNSKPKNKGEKRPITKVPESTADTRKRKREDHDATLDVMVDDDGEVTAVNSEDELRARLDALGRFQLQLLLHAFKFPAASKVTYSTCSIHAEENESVVRNALAHPATKEQGWRILTREEQIRGLKDWPVRGSSEACEGDEQIAESCIRASKDDEHGTMGFFLAGFVRNREPKYTDADFLRDSSGHMVRDIMGLPARKQPDEEDISNIIDGHGKAEPTEDTAEGIEEAWGGFEDEGAAASHEKTKTEKEPEMPPPMKVKAAKESANKHTHCGQRPQLIKRDKKRKKSKASN